MKTTKYIVVFVFAIFVLVSNSFAVPDSVINGQYKVFFDLGLNHSEYRTIVDKERTESLNGDEYTHYKILIFGDNFKEDFMEIAIMEHDKSQIENTGPYEAISNTLREDCRDFEIAKRFIDGVEGVVGRGIDNIETGEEEYYVSAYIPSFNPEYVRIIIFSIYPWKETSKFLKTIHVEEI